jgi:hypothetical protein
MATRVSYADCPSCGFPIYGRPGQSATCANCGISGTITGVSIPDPIFWGGLGLLAGFIIAKSKYIGAKLARI